MLYDIFNRIERIDRLIRIKGTGNAAQLADKLGLSRTSIYEYLDLMKQLGAPIKYSSARRSYYYDEDGSFPTSFQAKKQLIESPDNNILASITLLLISMFPLDIPAIIF